MPGSGRKFPSKEVVVGELRYASQTEAARAHGISPQLFGRRMAKGLTAAQALGIDDPPDWFVPGKGQLQRAKGQRRVQKERSTGVRRCTACKQEKALSEFPAYSIKNLNGAGRCKECTAKAWIKYRYKIEPATFFEMVKRQEGRCAICLTDLDLSTDSARRRKFAAIDHCHRTGEVRGLLCQPCNSGIGLLGDSVQRLAAAIDYLQAFEASKQQ